MGVEHRGSETRRHLIYTGPNQVLVGHAESVEVDEVRPLGLVKVISSLSNWNRCLEVVAPEKDLISVSSVRDKK